MFAEKRLGFLRKKMLTGSTIPERVKHAEAKSKKKED